MEYEFDKEIDSLLRQARPEPYVSERFNAHIDADEISLFAENALTQKSRMRVTGHLADCAKCRKILSSVIALNAEEASEIVHTDKPEAVIPEAKVPWYRRLFVFPQLAYTMGGLTVLLAGMIGYVTLQTYNESKNTSLAQMERSVERPRGAGGADSDGETVTVETYSANTASNAAPPPSVVASNAASAAVNSANTASKSNMPIPQATPAPMEESPAKKEQDPVILQAAPSAVAEATDALKSEKEAKNKQAKDEPDDAAETVARNDQQDYSRNSIVQNQTTIMPDSRSVQTRRAQNLPTVRAPENPRQSELAVTSGAASKPKSADDKKDSSERSRAVSGKDFVYRDGVWYDKFYKQQPTVTVRRNSDEYRKLNSGLRSISDNLSGTIVIVWKNKAYRIQ